MEHILFLYKPYSFSIRGLYIPISLLPNDLKEEFDFLHSNSDQEWVFNLDIKTSENSWIVTFPNFSDEKGIKILRKWEMFADDSPINDEILFLDGVLPEWYESSEFIFGNKGEKMTIEEFYNHAKSLNNVIKSVIVLEYPDKNVIV
jgi:uncharacterized protein (DUF2225 family)